MLRLDGIEIGINSRIDDRLETSMYILTWYGVSLMLSPILACLDVSAAIEYYVKN